MENKEKVKVISLVNHRVGVHIPELHISRQWLSKGASISFDREVLEEMMYDVGFRNMLTMGILYIEDMKTKQDLGLEPEDAQEPVNIIVLTDKEKRMYMTTLSLTGFKDKVKKLTKEQLTQLADYAIENKLLDVDKAKILKEACGRDIIQAVRLNELDKEA